MGHDLNLIVYDFFSLSRCSLEQVKAMVEGRDRRPELGFKLALELKNAENENKRGRRQV
jgi:hypothetical protein